MATLCTFILFLAFPGHTYYAVPAVITPKLYANTILVVLNSRMQILGGRTTLGSGSDTVTVNSIPNCVIRDNAATPSNPCALQRPVLAVKREAFSDHGTENSIELKGMNASLSETLEM